MDLYTTLIIYYIEKIRSRGFLIILNVAYRILFWYRNIIEEWYNEREKEKKSFSNKTVSYELINNIFLKIWFFIRRIFNGQKIYIYILIEEIFTFII